MPRLAILFAAVLFGTTGTAQALADTGTPLTVGAARIVAGGAVLAGVGLARRELRGLARSWRTVVACSLGIAGYQLSFFVAVRETGVAVGTVVAIGAAAVLTGGLEWLVEGSRPGRRWAVATGLAVAGLVLLAVTSSTGTRVSAVGLLLALAAAAGYASYAVLSKRLLQRGHPPAGVMGSTFGLAGVFLLPVLLAGGTSWLTHARGIGLVVYLAAGPTAAAYLLYAYGLRKVTASEATTIGLAEPLVAALLGAIVLHEHLGPAALAGGGLILSSLLVLTLRVPRLRTWRPLLSER